MDTEKRDRRQFLRESGSAVGAFWALQATGAAALINISCARRDQQEAFVNLTDAEAAVLEAVTGQIIPTTETPGAIEAGVIYFIDTAISEGMPFGPMKPVLKQGAADLTATAAGLDESSPGLFEDLDFDVQKSLIEDVQDSPFFGMMTVLTKVGFFGDPRYGGNKGGMSWDLISYDTKHAWQPPFGYYDANAETEGAS